MKMSQGLEPECMVREPESNYKGVRVGARSQWILCVEPESMT